MSYPVYPSPFRLTLIPPGPNVAAIVLLTNARAPPRLGVGITTAQHIVGICVARVWPSRPAPARLLQRLSARVNQSASEHGEAFRAMVAQLAIRW